MSPARPPLEDVRDACAQAGVRLACPHLSAFLRRDHFFVEFRQRVDGKGAHFATATIVSDLNPATVIGFLNAMTPASLAQILRLEGRFHAQEAKILAQGHAHAHYAVIRQAKAGVLLEWSRVLIEGSTV